MDDLPGWAWPVALFAGVGLALGVVLGALSRRRSKPNTSSATPPRSRNANTLAGHPAPASANVDTPLGDGLSPVTPLGTPQQRLLERLREQNLQLATQLKSMTDQYARQMSERQQEQQAENLRRDLQLEALRQQHSADFTQLLAVAFEALDHLQVAHGHHTQALNQELEHLRALAHKAAETGGGDKGSGRARLEMAVQEVRQAEFAATHTLESLRLQD